MVRELLGCGPRKAAEEHRIGTYSAVLHQSLDRTACKGQLMERKLLNDVYQITSLLLEHNADPDMSFKQPLALSITAREAAEWNPDLRVRNLLLGAKVVEQPNLPRSKFLAYRGTRRRDQAEQSYSSMPWRSYMLTTRVPID
jgi:hypothetical protein